MSTIFYPPREQKQDDWLAPAYFLLNYNLFDQLLQTVEKSENCFESSFQKFPKHINFTTDF